MDALKPDPDLSHLETVSWAQTTGDCNSTTYKCSQRQRVAAELLQRSREQNAQRRLGERLRATAPPSATYGHMPSGASTSIVMVLWSAPCNSGWTQAQSEYRDEYSAIVWQQGQHRGISRGQLQDSPATDDTRCTSWPLLGRQAESHTQHKCEYVPWQPALSLADTQLSTT